MSIIIKNSFFNLLMNIAAILGSPLMLYCFFGLRTWCSYQPTLCEYNPFDALIFIFVHWPISVCAIPHEQSIICHLPTSLLDVGSGVRSVTIRVRTRI